MRFHYLFNLFNFTKCPPVGTPTPVPGNLHEVSLRIQSHMIVYSFSLFFSLLQPPPCLFPSPYIILSTITFLFILFTFCLTFSCLRIYVKQCNLKKVTPEGSGVFILQRLLDPGKGNVVYLEDCLGQALAVLIYST